MHASSVCGRGAGDWNSYGLELGGRQTHGHAMQRARTAAPCTYKVNGKSYKSNTK